MTTEGNRKKGTGFAVLDTKKWGKKRKKELIYLIEQIGSDDGGI